jgi:hypothetical protein
MLRQILTKGSLDDVPYDHSRVRDTAAFATLSNALDGSAPIYSYGTSCHLPAA